MIKKILIVEDDQDIRKNLELLFESEGYTVEVAHNGQMALELLLNTRLLPGLIVLDLMMPILDGYQFREEQRKNPRLANIPVVIMTADGLVDEKRLKTGAVAAIRKPADIDTILAAVQRYGQFEIE